MGVYGYLSIVYPESSSIYLRGTIGCEGFRVFKEDSGGKHPKHSIRPKRLIYSFWGYVGSL